MRWTLLLVLIAACGGGDSSNGGTPKDLSHWTGTAWNGGTTAAFICNQTTPAVNSVTAFVLSPGTGADLQYTSREGCIYKFNLSGSAASLANGPVSCAINMNGVLFAISVTSYTMTTTDGHNLNEQVGGTVAVAPTLNCGFAIGGELTR
jgi:hypothetical protein